MNSTRSIGADRGCVPPASCRRIFHVWLRLNRKVLQGKALSEIVARFPGQIAISTARRAATCLGMMGQRSNTSRYAAFWREINWQLPDASLAAIWCIDRGNLRARRVRTRAGKPKWHAAQHQHDPVFRAAVRLEQLKARRFTGLKPASPSYCLNDDRPLLGVARARDGGHHA